jgi:hypothetical protein
MLPAEGPVMRTVDHVLVGPQWKWCWVELTGASVDLIGESRYNLMAFCEEAIFHHIGDTS